jgi:hypothetical protein
MGYGSYEVARRGEAIEAGYLVSDVCNLIECKVEIDRGMGFLCGAIPGGDEYGCGGYFCDDHLYIPSEKLGEPTVQGLCGTCWDRWFAQGWKKDT